MEIEEYLRQELNTRADQAPTKDEVMSRIETELEVGGRRHQWLMPALISAAVVILITAAAFALDRRHGDPEPPASVEVVPLSTNDWHPGDVSAAAGLRGRVAVSTAGCVYLDAEGGEIANIIWPSGFNASLDPATGVTSIYDDDGNEVATEGTLLNLGGGEAQPDAAMACKVPADYTFSVMVDLAPLER